MNEKMADQIGKAVQRYNELGRRRLDALEQELKALNSLKDILQEYAQKNIQELIKIPLAVHYVIDLNLHHEIPELMQAIREHLMNKPSCNCRASTGIHGGLTFGRGPLDNYGFWARPCEACARWHEAQDNKPLNSYWPFSAECNDGQPSCED